MSVDANGKPVGLLAVCGHHLDTARLYRTDPDASTSDEAHWTATRRAGPSTTTWRV
ncbi:hypothetical protein ACWERV_34150 [Streptomyces sp. NPDC004031]